MLIVSKNLLVSLHQKVSRQPLIKVGGFFVNFTLLPSYKVYLFGKRQINKVYFPSGNKFWDIITHRFIIHGIIIVIGLLVASNNIQARVAGFRDETYGQQTILYSLVGGEDVNILIEETAQSNSNTAPTTYLGYQTGVSSSAPTNGNIEEVPELSSTTQGGGALVKPDISSMEEPEGRSRISEEAYVVQAGDTIGSIASKFGISVETILWANDLTARSYIRPGDKLVILPSSGVNHKVKRGESLASIAKQYDISKEEIIAYNELPNENSVSIGQSLFIPGGKKLPTAPAPAPKTVASAPIRSYVGAPPASAIPSSTKLQWPTSSHVINQYFSWRHSGVDIDGEPTSPIYAAEAGTVLHAYSDGWNGGCGRGALINHGNGIMILYCHMSKIFVGAGEQVTRGQTIGMVGSTGRSTGNHLHFEVRIGGRSVNPLTYTR